MIIKGNYKYPYPLIINWISNMVYQSLTSTCDQHISQMYLIGQERQTNRQNEQTYTHFN